MADLRYHISSEQKSIVEKLHTQKEEAEAKVKVSMLKAAIQMHFFSSKTDFRGIYIAFRTPTSRFFTRQLRID